MALLRSYLFAPGSDEKLLRKAFEAGADAVVLDLEDAVPVAEKARARALVAKAVEGRPPGGPPVYVRVNGVESDLWREDVEAVVGPALAGVRLPKAEASDQVRRLDEALSRAEERSGTPVGSVAVTCTIETAKGALAARELAASPRVRNLSFGAADFARDVGADPGEDEAETLHARSALVLASRAAGIDPPIAPVHTRLSDDEGLRRTTEAARRLGYFGRSLIHPRQIAIVHDVFTPRAEQVARAVELIEAYDRALARGSGGAVTTGGCFVDLAVVRRARAIVELARSLGSRPRKGTNA